MKLFFLFIAILSIFTTGIVFWSLNKLKNFNKTKFIHDTNYIFDRFGEPVGNTSPNMSIYKPLNQFPTTLIKTILMVEDNNFYSNYGVDIKGLIRSVILFIPSILSGRRPKGGSTITQQLMRFLFLNHNLSFYRKYVELVMSVVASQIISKDDVLEVYMNNAYFCNNIYGFNSATHLFWGKNVNELNLHEIAILVGMLRGPNYSPVKSNSKIFERKNFILKKMYEKKMITKEDFEKNVILPVEIDHSRFFHVNYTSLNVKNAIINKFGIENYEKGGYKVYLTIDQKIQNIAQEKLEEICFCLERDTIWLGPVDFCDNFSNNILNKHLEKCGKFYTPVIITNKNGNYKGVWTSGILNENALQKYQAIKPVTPGDIVILHTKTRTLTNFPSYNGQVTIIKNGSFAGDILASVGGIDLTLFRDNIAKQIPRTMGSCIKIINMLAIHEICKYPTNFQTKDDYGVVKNNKFIYVSKEDFDRYKHNYENGNHSVWAPGNWDSKHFGNLTIRAAFEYSRNIPFMELILNHVGPEKYKNFLDQLGITKESEDFIPSMILGCVEITPENVASLVCGLINFRHNIKPQFIKEICNKRNEIIFESEDIKKENPVISKQSLYMLLSEMQGAVDRGMSKALKGTMNHIYSKTGTSSNNRDAFSLCITKDFVIFVSISKNDGKSLGYNVFGARYPVICIRNILNSIQDKKDEPFFDVIPKNLEEIEDQYNKFDSPDILNIIIKEIIFKNSKKKD